MPFDEEQYQRSPCSADTPVVRISQGQKQLVDLVLRDENGQPKDLTELVEALENESSSSATGGELQVRLAASHCLNASLVDLEMTGEIRDAATGAVRFQFQPQHSATPGIFVASVGVFYRDILRFNQMHYLEFMPTNFTLNTGGPITVPEVRMELMDMCSDANYLLDELEFTDAEIIHAMRWTVDQFNEMNPPVGGYSYDAFPFRANWMSGTAAHLLKMIAHRYRRNALKYSAGGLSVADQEKYQEYTKAAEVGETKFMAWAERKKVSINIEAGYGSVGPSAYGRGRR
jgi:hypothetical protein